MLNYENFAISFARAVELFRSRPDAIREQKGALRALVALTKLGGVTFRIADRTLTIGSEVIPASLPGIKSLIAQLEIHGIEGIHIARNASPAELLSLLRGIALQLSGFTERDSVGARMDGMNATSVRVLTVAAAAKPAEGRVTAAFEAAGLVETPAERTALEEATAAARRSSSLDIALADLALDPAGGRVLDRLTAIAKLIEQEIEGGRTDFAVRAIESLVRLERGLEDGGPRRSLSITLNRILNPAALAEIVRLVEIPEFRESATYVLHRGGAEAGEVLLQTLVRAEAMVGRRAYFDVLRGLPEGIPQFLHLLDHHQWYVVRNMAELVGEMCVEEAVPALGRAIGHEDARVRKAAGVALARIGTAETVQYIRDALRRGDTDVRSLVAGAVGGRRSGALAMPLVLAAEDEPDAELQREFYLALARIGTPEALQALIKAAQPGGRFFRRRKVETRVAAIHGLRAAGGPAAIGALEGLRQDRNAEVRDAARAALETLQA